MSGPNKTVWNARNRKSTVIDQRTFSTEAEAREFAASIVPPAKATVRKFKMGPKAKPFYRFSVTVRTV